MLKISAAVGIIASLINRGDAELSFLDLKGIDDLVDHPGASPLYGYVALKTFLPNRRFLGNYGAAKRGLCTTRGLLAEGLRKKNDCPLDANSELVQRLFPSPDGVNFVANQIPSDIVTRLKPFAIGRVLDKLAMVEDDQWTDDAAMAKLKSDLSYILFESINESRFVFSILDGLQKKAAKRAKRDQETVKYLTMDPVTFDEVAGQVKRLLESIDSEGFESNLEQLTEKLIGASPGVMHHVSSYIETRIINADDLLAKILAKLSEVEETNKVIAEKIRELRSSANRETLTDLDMLIAIKRRVRQRESSSSDEQIGERKDFEALANVIVEAVQESRGALPVPNGAVYPKFMPEHTLLAFFVSRSESKRDMVALFDGMSGIVKDRRWFDRIGRGPLVDDFSRARWSPSELDPHFTLQKNSRYLSFEGMWDAEFKKQVKTWALEKKLFQLISIDQSSKKLPRPLSYGEATHRGGKYPDCGETSLRNFFNNMLYDPRSSSLDMGLFDVLEAEDPEVSFKRALRDFYETYPTVTAGVVEDARNLWGSTVVADHDGVVYKKAGYEIRSLGDPDNMLVLIGQLLFSGESARGIRERRWTRKSREGKLDTLCAVFSTPSRQVSWAYAQKVPKGFEGVRIEFKFNGEDAFSYVFDKAHFAVSNVVSTSDDDTWRELLRRKGFVPGPADPHRYLVPMLVDDLSYKRIGESFERDRNFQLSLFYAIDLLDFASQLRGFAIAIELISDGFGELEFVAKRIRSMLPEETDPYTATRIESTLYEFRYPLGIPTHTRNRPDAVYRPVSRDELTRMFGSASADVVGESFARRLFGRTELIITDLIRTRSSGWNSHSRTQAVDMCIALNPVNEQERIRAEISAREAALDSLRKTSQYSVIVMDCSLDGPIAKIHNNFPISGFHLLGMEEFGCIFTDMGATDLLDGSGYIHQILPHLDENQWTSSQIDGSPVSVGAKGLTFAHRIETALGVRCGADILPH